MRVRGGLVTAQRHRRTAAERLARAVVFLRYPLAVAWIAAAVVATFYLPTIREAQVGSLGDLVPNEAAAIDAELRSVELFGFPVLSRTLVVQRNPDGLSFFDQLDAVQRAVDINRGEIEPVDGIGGALVITNALGEPPFSLESSTTAISYLFFGPDVGQVERTGLARRLIGTSIAPEPGGTVGVTGTIPARAAQAEEIRDALPLVEAATILLVGLAVGLHFRALGAPLVNLLAVGLAYLISVRVLAYAGSEIGVSIPSEVEPVIVVLLFGVITDYSIFFMSRFRQIAEDGESRIRAAERTTAELLPIVVTAGLTIILGSATLAAAQLGFLQAFGPGMALSVGIGLLVGITFVPAVLAIGGQALFWPGRRGGREPVEGRRVGRGARTHPAGGAQASDAAATPRFRPRRVRPGGRGGRVDRPQPRSAIPLLRRPPPRVDLPPGGRSLSITLASRFPLTVAVGCIAVLLLAATGLSRLEPANPLIRGLPAESEVKRAYEAASKGFAAGILAPTVVVVEADGLSRRRVQLARFQAGLAAQPGVAEVIGPADQPLGEELGAALSETGDAARYVLVLNADPLGGRAIGFLDGVQARTPSLLAAAGLGGATASFAGDTALIAETVELTFDDLATVAPLLSVVVLLVLAVFLRALLAPLYLLASSVLALGATLGLLIYVFEDVLGHGDITYYVPFAAAVLLISLGSDYNVFLVGRIWSDARKRPIGEAIVTGGASAARPITAAGLVLAGSFALLALVPIRSFRELAFTMSVGLLIDAFLVRTLLIPALMSLAGPWSAWPSRRLHRTEPAPRRARALR